MTILILWDVARSHNITIIDLADPNQVPYPMKTRTSGFQGKIYALLNTNFQHVLLLDSDSIPLADPTPLFSSPEYQEAGALFWPDFWVTSRDNPIYDITDTTWEYEYEFESGQMVVDRKRAWKALQLTA